MHRAILALAALLACVALGAAGDWGQSAAQQGGRAAAVTVGDGHACALLESGRIECWGSNDSGRADPPAGRFSAVSAGTNHTCALTPSGEAECWGSNLVRPNRSAGGPLQRDLCGPIWHMRLAPVG